MYDLWLSSACRTGSVSRVFPSFIRRIALVPPDESTDDTPFKLIGNPVCLVRDVVYLTACAAPVERVAVLHQLVSALVAEKLPAVQVV